jgi:hypothetical protein
MANSRMAAVYEKLYKAVCNQSTNNVVTVAYEIFGKPVLFVDEYFHVVSMYPSGPIGDPAWDEIYQNKAMNREQIFSTLDEFLSGKKAFYKPFFANTGSCAQSPRLFAEVVQDDNVHGHLIVFWDGAPPTQEDYEIIELVLDAIRLRISSRIKSMGSWNLALSTKLEDLLAPNTPPRLERLACEAISGTMQPDYSICVTTIGALASQRAFAEYAVRELQQLYRNVICTIYDSSIVILYGGANPHGSGTPMPKESMANRLFAFFESHDMICGLSDSFKDPSETRVHYRQALLTARLAQQLGQARSTTFSDLMPLPIFLSVLEKDSPETFIHPAIFKMRAYDQENGTSYDETMRVFSFNMHNKDKTAAELCIHRNTLLYRLGRISDLFQLPFEHDQVALNLLCSYLILELGRYGSPQTMSRLSSTEQTETEIKRD